MAESKQEKESPAKGGETAGGGRPSRHGDARAKKPGREKEIGGPKGLEPTRYGDWERKGIASDF